jgi:hypothetical protein
VLDYENHQGLIRIISDINKKYYEPARNNIFFIEEYERKNCIAYMAQIRDAYNHLMEIFKHEDIIKNKEKIKKQLIDYLGHLERIIIDTFQRITELKFASLLESVQRIKSDDLSAIKTQIAIKIKDLRIMSESISTDEKIIGYNSLIQRLDDLLIKYHAAYSSIRV